MTFPSFPTLRRWASRALPSLACGAALVVAAVGTGAAQAQWLLMPDSTNNRLVQFDSFDGTLENASLFGLAGGTPVHAVGVGNEIWVSEQTGDRVSRWGYDGTALGQIGGQFAGGGLDNIRGMAVVGSTVFVTNAGSANDAPGPSLLMFDTSGTAMGQFSTVGAAPSPFGALAVAGGLLVSSSSADDDVHRFSLTGTSLGTFYNGATLNFGEQLALASNGDILVAGFSSNNVVRFSPTGSVVSSFAAAGARGVAQLGNGNIMWTSGAGAFIYDVATSQSTQIYAGGGRFLQTLTPVPEPASVAMVLSGLGLIGWQLRRRTRG